MTLKKISILIFIFLINPSINANEIDLYQQVLSEHLSAGHIEKEQMAQAQYAMERDQKIHPHFQKQVRGVASAMFESQKTLKIQNPVIEILID